MIPGAKAIPLDTFKAKMATNQGAFDFLREDPLYTKQSGCGTKGCVEVFYSQEGVTAYSLMCAAQQVCVGVVTDVNQISLLFPTDFDIRGNQVVTRKGVNGQPIYIVYSW